MVHGCLFVFLDFENFKYYLIKIGKVEFKKKILSSKSKLSLSLLKIKIVFNFESIIAKVTLPSSYNKNKKNGFVYILPTTQKKILS